MRGEWGVPVNHTRHSSCNGALGAPDGWDQDQLPCDAIAITRSTVEGYPCVSSFWRPTPEELALLNAGGLVVLGVIGHTMPPVMLDVTPAEPEPQSH